jgi:histidinol-phosphate aminotransferase
MSNRMVSRGNIRGIVSLRRERPTVARAVCVRVSDVPTSPGRTADAARPLAEPLDTLKLDANETTVPPSPLVAERLHACIENGSAAFYPDPDALAVRRRLGEYASRPVSQVLAFNGSDATLDCAVRALASPGDRVVICSPCYDRFRLFASVYGAVPDLIYSADPFTADITSLLDAVDSRTRLVYVSNPNNPTGRMYSSDDLERLLRRLTSGVLLVDEAYYEFSGRTVTPLLDRHDNLLITRSLSKAFGLAGLRCGYTLSSDAIAARLRTIWNGREMNVMAQIATIAALDDLAYSDRYVRQVLDAREWLTRELRTRGFDARSTPGNFILLRVADPANLLDQLRRVGVYIRNRSDLPQLDGFVRVTVGTRPQCERFLEALCAKSISTASAAR